jgi:nucleotide-binding universal stress UspA family protein
MIQRLLLAVDDSPAALRAARLAIDLAARLNARLLVVHVVRDHGLTDVVARATHRPDAAERRADAAESVLGHVTRLAEAAGVKAEPHLLGGDPATRILDAARSPGADMIVMGRSTRRDRSVTAHVAEFTEHPLLIVPVPPPRH